MPTVPTISIKPEYLRSMSSAAWTKSKGIKIVGRNESTRMQTKGLWR
jgi:hypothetical protein